MRLPDKSFFRFIKRYPRISILGGIILLLIVAVLPGSFERNFKLLIGSAILGFFLALGIKYFLAKRKSKRS